MSVFPFIDWQKPSLWYSVAITIAVPLWWNITARLEYKTHFLTKLFFGNKYVGCYFLAAAILAASTYRQYVFKLAADEQQEWAQLPESFSFGIQIIAGVLFVGGWFLVGAAYYRLGITGTYLGDYFGILMKERVVDFPFSHFDNPMYDGSAVVFLSEALLWKKPAAVFLAIVIYVVYHIAIVYEGDFTGFIYSEAARQKQSKKTTTVIVNERELSPTPTKKSSTSTKRSASKSPTRSTATKQASRSTSKSRRSKSPSRL